MTARRIFSLLLLLVLALVAWGGWWVTDWMWRHPIPASGGLYFPARVVVSVPQFFQQDPKWGAQSLAGTPSTMGGEGCAVASAAMVLASYGVDVDPGRLNDFLIKTPGGYTPEGWIYWEKAAEFSSALRDRLLPHYENRPSFFLIDWNLIEHNPVIIRLRYPSGTTHFVVICGKEGYDYLIRDPGRGGEKGVYPLKEFGSDIEALRFYRKP
jgi:Peptidase_C39 like family